MCTKQDLIKQRKLCVNALTCALRMLSGSSSLLLVFHRCLLTRFDRAHGRIGHMEAEIALESQTACNDVDRSSSQLNQPPKSPKGVYNILNFSGQKLSKPKTHRKEFLRVFLDIFRPPNHNSEVYLA